MCESLRSSFYILKIIFDQEDSQRSEEVVQVFSYERRIIVQKEFVKVSPAADAV